MGLSTYIPYLSVLGLAAKSTRWNQSMKIHVTKMAFHASEAVELQENAASQQMSAEEALSKAEADRAKATVLEEEGEVLITQGEKDAALAGADETAEAESAAKAVEEEAVAITDTTEAATQQLIFQENLAKADADASLASKHGFQAGEDEIGVGLCEFIPILDVLCDFIGGAASIGLDTAATQEVARSAVEYATAASAKKVEDTFLTEAAELHASSLGDTEAAAEFEVAAKELEEKAEAEVSEGEADEATAQEKLAQSKAEEELAEIQEKEAATQEAKASKSLSESLASGVSAWLDAFFVGMGSVLAFSFFAGRRFFGAVSHSVQYATKMSQENSPRLTCFTIRDLSHAFHHLFLLGIISGFFGSSILSVKSLNMTSRGELLLQLAATISISQSLLLHCHSNEFVRRETTWYWRINAGFVVLIRSFVIILALVIMEILLLSILVGIDSVLPVVIPFLRNWYIYFLFSVSIIAHYVFIERNEWSRENKEKERNIHDHSEQISLLSNNSFLDIMKPNYGSSNDNTVEKSSQVDNVISAQNIFCIESLDEAEIIDDFRKYNRKLIDDDNVPLEDSHPDIVKIKDAKKNIIKSNSQESSHFQMLWRDIELLIIPFEVLLIMLMVALLRSCFPNLSQLWPTVKPILISKCPERLKDEAILISAVFICVIAYIFWLQWILQKSFNPKENKREKTVS